MGSSQSVSLIVFLLSFACVAAQELTATRFEVSGPVWNGVSGALIGTRDVIPLVIANTSPTAQPIRFFAGANGAVRAMEVTTNADVWMRGSLSVGALTGAAANELARISTIPSTNGRGLVIDLTGTTTSTGLLVQNVGLTGIDDAGVMLQSVSNGTGTGIRIGGPQAAGRPTFSTGVDITGGVGLRYNALNAGSGTAFDIGGTTAPSKGIDATVSGSGSIGVLARANSTGAGVIGLSQSASYSSVPSVERVGVMGRAASNSTVGADTLVGVYGNVIRGGNGGTLTTSIAIRASANTSGTNHAGTSIGLLSVAEAIAPGVGVAIGGVFITPDDDLSLVAIGGDVLLGCAAAYQPTSFTASTLTGTTQSQTQVYDVQVSGVPSFVNHATQVLPLGVTPTLFPADAPIVRVLCDINGSDIAGIDDIREGRILTIINTLGVLNITAENLASIAQNRILTPAMANLAVPVNGSVTLWYDIEDNRWRVVSTNF